MKGSIQATGVPKRVAIPRLNRRGERVLANIYFGSTFFYTCPMFLYSFSIYYFFSNRSYITRERHARPLDTIRHQFYCFNSAVTMAVKFYRFPLVFLLLLFFVVVFHYLIC